MSRRRRIMGHTLGFENGEDGERHDLPRGRILSDDQIAAILALPDEEPVSPPLAADVLIFGGEDAAKTDEALGSVSTRSVVVEPEV